ncbi:MAG TPA: hypothetical protein VFP34_19775 [Microlunatus sp.]|nr:hypothetical protein [Microlunatus sp.]
MNTITNNPDHALTIAQRLIDDHIQAAQRRAQIHQLRAVRRAERRQSHTAATPATTPATPSATVPRTPRTSFPQTVFGFLHGAR